MSEPACKRCNRIRKGEPYQKGRDCRACWLYHHDPRYNVLFGGDGKVVAMNQNSRLLTPLRTHIVEFPGMPHNNRTNSSIAEWNGKFWFAWREGWGGARIGLANIDLSTYEISDPKILNAPINVKFDSSGREDPRLFVLRGELWIAFTGYAMRVTNVCFAKVEGCTLHGIIVPRYAKRQPWEKNWGAFEHRGELYAVHRVTPHRILRIKDGNATFSYETEFVPAWQPWELRGGGSPVRIGDEWYSWIHGHQLIDGRKTYCLSLYTFDAFPPFAPRRIVAGPLMRPDPAEKSLMWSPTSCDVIYPGGALLRDGKWTVTGGYYDRECRIWEFDAGAVERLLEPVNTSSAILTAKRRQPTDRVVVGDLIQECDTEADFLSASDNYGWYAAIGDVFRPKRILELGVRFGYSLKAIIRGSMQHHAPSDMTIRGLDSEQENDGCLDVARRYFASIGIAADFQRLNLRELTAIPMLAIDLAHMDADHSEQGTYEDIGKTWNCLRPGGVLLVDDVDYIPAVKKAVHRWAAEKGVHVEYVPSFRGLYILRKDGGNPSAQTARETRDARRQAAGMVKCPRCPGNVWLKPGG